MSDEELIARLREIQGQAGLFASAAAARIVDANAARIDAEKKLRKSALQELSALGQASEAYQAQLAAEAKLAKAVEALEDLVRDCEADYPPSHVAIKYFAIGALAEIKGDTP